MGRRLVGAAIFLLGGWLLWLPLHPALLYINRGAPVVETLLDPVFLLPMLRGLAAMIAGVLAMNALRGAAVWSGGAALLSLLIGGLLFAVGQGSVPYLPHFIHGAVLAGLTSALFALPRETRAT